MDLDLKLDEATERSESSMVKPPSPTTERPSNGNHGDGFPGDRSTNYNSHWVTDLGDSVGAMSRENVDSELPLKEKTPLSKKIMESFDDDADMPPLQYDEERTEIDAKNGKNRDNEAADLADSDEEWLDVLGNGLIKKKILVEGEGIDSRPLRSERVTLDIECKLDDGTVVESETGYLATLAEGDLTTAVDMCVALMQKGETCEMQTAPKYAYGSYGLPPSIPSDAHLNYTLSLTDVKPALDLETLSIADRIKYGTAKRERGNYYFARNEHPQALSCYTKAIEVLRRPQRTEGEAVESEALKELLDVEAKCYNNLAAAQLKMEAYDAAIISCDGVLRLQPDNVKALFRKGKALGCKGNFDAAVAILRKALKIEPESKLIHTELARLVGEQRGEANKERDMYKKMFGQDQTEAKEENNNTRTLLMGLAALILAVIMGLLLYNNRQDL